MRILEVASYLFNPDLQEFTKNKTGYGIIVSELLIALANTGNEIYFYSHVITDEKKCNGFTIIKHTWIDVLCNVKIDHLYRGIKSFFKHKQSLRMRLRYLYYHINGSYFERILSNLKPDIVHIHGCTQAFWSLMKACEKNNIPYIVTLHGLIGLNDSIKCATHEKEAEKKFLRRADNENIPITVISSGIKNKAITEYILTNPDNISIIPNGTSIKADAFIPNIEIKKGFGISEDAIIIISIGRVCQNKNQIQIIHAFNSLVKKYGQKIYLYIIGQIDYDYPIEKEIKNLNLESNVKCLGFLNRLELNKIFQIADLNILFSLEEGFGLSIIEGFQFGVPSVMCKKMDAFHDLYDIKAIASVEYYDTNLLSIAIDGAIKKKWDKEYIKKYGERFNIEAMTKKYLDVFNNVCE